MLILEWQYYVTKLNGNDYSTIFIPKKLNPMQMLYPNKQKLAWDIP